MSVRQDKKFFISTSTPEISGLGDEWLNTSNNFLYKNVLNSGRYEWQQIVTAPTTSSGSLIISGRVEVGNILNVTSTATLSGPLLVAGITTVTNTTAASNFLTGSLQTKGGIGVSGAIYTSGLISAGTSISATTTVSDGAGNVRDYPVRQVSTYTLVAADNGRTVSITTGGILLPPNVFASGNNINIYNSSSVAQSILPTGSITLYLGGTATTGTRTLAGYGFSTIYCINTQTFVILGAGVT